MKKDIKDYLHLYVGCEVSREHSESRSKKFIEHGRLVGVSASEVEVGETVAVIDAGLDHFHEWYVSETKPLLRPLSDMKEEEAAHIDRMARRQKDGQVTPANTKFVTGIRTETAEALVYLLSKSFDLFGLIEDGLAIDKTQIATDTILNG